MNLITCSECGQPLSSAALACLHCGAPGKPAKPGGWAWLFALGALFTTVGSLLFGILFLIVFVALVLSCV